MVPLTFLRKKAAHSVPLLLAALIFTGCGTQAPDQSTAHMQGSAQADSGFYLQQMSQSTNDTRINWQLLAIRALLKEGKTQQAAELFSQLPQDLNDTQRHEQTLLSAELKVAQKDYDGAKKILGTIDLSTLDKNQQARFWQAGITAEQGRPSLTLLRALIAQEPLLAGADKQKNIDATWQALASMTQDQAKALVINADENVLQGWLDLQQMWFNNRSDPNMLKAGITDWQKRYPQNPGAKMLPTQLVNVQNFKPASTSKIALLLPLNGQAAVFGRAIQQGFEAAKNGTTAVSGSAVPTQAAQAANVNDVVSPSAAETSDLTTAQTPAQGTMQNPVTAPTTQPAPPAPAATQAPAETPAPATAEQPQPQTAQPEQQPATQPQAVAITSANPGAELKIYDTSAQPLDQVLAQVQQDGASIVVGPLLKNNVEALMKSNTTLNVLALNQPEQVQNRANICYFALSPEDEARDAARHIHEQGKQAPLLLIPRSTLGDRVANAFAQEWQTLGGGVVLQQKFGSASELRAGVNGGAGIALNGSPVSASLPQQQSVTIGGLTIPAPPTDAQISGGGKVDSAYIVATPEEIAFIKPMIAMRNGSQSGATLYASSRSAQGTAGPDFRLEMEGLQYSEIPMLAGSNPQLMQQALGAVRNDYSLARLYAMGVDAWALANHFTQMRQVPGFELNGNTGDLTADQDCVINRKLSWLKYQQGQIVPAS
ncbi:MULTISPECIES: penicillin-binding protein activator [Enterobacter cloacae complex]|uniref:penicillin-binding protein activator n=1 Tax=Enterobacter cloacae complex TaxID=354276 RepID=UPI000F0B3077|nr:MULTISPECIES: penicillin-binding protein activator [Enterobacter cloacae complex]AYU96975.1 penicillin-binding protein activator [Enterobacter cloacae]HCJ6299660.1 penicillin-binding protein activator [Enterobacter hormaechei subsp. xiangfangensis]MBE4885557.1 penicillin-binding protein activator [Enterobacter cloacae complex sp. P37RS]MBE7430714.1 penicillin-binding protein activator [Enterobacter cloacae complex sp. P36RS]MCC4521649.1 penicillin-binding protein activator [Enterobacter hor